MSESLFDASITVRLPKALKQRLQGEADMLGLTLTEYVRFLLSDKKAQGKLTTKMKRKAHKEAYAHIQILLSKTNIANNMNQIARSLNVGTANLHCPDMKVQISQANQTMSAIYSALIHDVTKNESIHHVD